VTVATKKKKPSQLDSVILLLEAQNKALDSHLPVLKHHDEILKRLEGRFETLEKRLGGFAFTGVEMDNLVGELRAMRHLLDDKGKFRDMDKPKPAEDPA
jgi:hypothetical protein